MTPGHCATSDIDLQMHPTLGEVGELPLSEVECSRGVAEEEGMLEDDQLDSESDGTWGTAHGENTDMSRSAASTEVRERLRIMESNMVIADSQRSGECFG